MPDPLPEREDDSPSADEALITVTEDGPYRVEGGLPLVRARIEYSEFGEPIEWHDGPEFGPRDSYDLCRCGQSNTKPYCDSSHELVDFDGTETADRGPSSARRTVYGGDGLTMTDDRTLCSRAGFCRNRFTSVWEMMEETSDPEIREQVTAMVSRCPSGRLQYSTTDDQVPVEAELSPAVGVEPNGPYVVRGGVRIMSEDGGAWEVRNRVALCRCGESANKPFCDGSHERIGFRDAALPSEAVPLAD
jgi:CDGSH-type Zn-finger protein